MTPQLLKELGLETAGNNLDQKLTLKKKLTLAYEHFKVVTPSIFQRFNEEMKSKTLKVEQHDKYRRTERWRQLKFTALKDYKEVPPPDCLMDLKKAIDMKLFDNYTVATVEEVSTNYDTRPVPDPIIFGLINGSDDHFFITQWDDDLSIEEILKHNEG